MTDSTFIRTLYENEVYVAAEKLQATTYPFVTFIALQPRRRPGSAASSFASSRSTSPSLTVLSRHQGKGVSATTPTSAPTLVAHLEQRLLPRVQPLLGRIAAAAQCEREHERHLRDEQDRAFQDTARRDFRPWSVISAER